MTCSQVDFHLEVAAGKTGNNYPICTFYSTAERVCVRGDTNMEGIAMSSKAPLDCGEEEEERWQIRVHAVLG